MRERQPNFAVSTILTRPYTIIYLCSYKYLSRINSAMETGAVGYTDDLSVEKTRMPIARGDGQWSCQMRLPLAVNA